MLYTFFHKREAKDAAAIAAKPSVVFDYHLELDTDEQGDVMAILEAAWAAGLPKGSARAGCFEIQCDDGIWTSSNGKRLTPRNTTFTPWE